MEHQDRTGRFTGMKQAAVCLLTGAMLLSTILVLPAYAKEETKKEAAAETFYDVDQGDAEYWKYYDEEGQPADSGEQESAPEKNGQSGIATQSSSSSIKSPYTGKSYTVRSGYNVIHGVDVSKYQETVDWAKAKKDGIDYAIIRCAYRGYGSSGTLNPDPYFEKHAKDALDAGIQIGTYIYSQAITEEEAEEEARYCISVCKKYLGKMDLPVVMDVEYAEPGGDLGGRLYNAGLSAKKQTQIAEAFCKTMEEAGYQAMVYANRAMLTDEMDASSLTDSGYSVWLAHYTTKTNYSASPYLLWQYSESGDISGVPGNADVNFMFLKQNLNRTPKLKSLTLTTEEGLALSWGPVFGADGFEVMRSTDGSSWKRVKTVQSGIALGYTDSSAKDCATYYYKVRSFYLENGSKKYSKYSSILSYQFKLEQPVLTRAVSKGYNSIQVSWESVNRAQGYRVYRREGEGKWKRLAILEGSDTSYTDKKNVVCGTAYTYTVRAYYTDGEGTRLSSYDKKGLTTKAIPSTPNVKLASTKKGKVTVSWKAISGTTGYVVYQKTPTDTKWRRAKVIKDATVTIHTVTAPSGKTCYYTVRAYRTVNQTNVYSGYMKNEKIAVK